MNGRSFPARLAGRPLLAVAAIAILGVASCRSRTDLTAGASPQPKAAPAVIDPAAASIGTPRGRFVGSADCRPCHEAIWKAWDESRHHATLRPVGPATLSRIAAASPRDGYEIAADGSVTGPGVDGRPLRAQAAYVVGGRHREDLWVRLDDGRLQVFPLSWDVDSGDAFFPLRVLSGGDAPPAESLQFWTRLGRSADLVCYGCHATGAVVTVAGATPAGNAVPRSRWAEAGVGCEACHGPGGAHVDAAHAGPPPHGSIGSGKHADAETAVAACAACHGLRELLASPFRPDPAQGYGEPLWQSADPVLRPSVNFEFREAFFEDLRPATYQQEGVALGQSSCVRRGGLTCSACHDVHSGAPSAAMGGPSSGDEACRPCHEAVVQDAARHSRHPAGSAGARCLGCHMPPILRGPGKAAARDHSLSPPWARPGDVPAACAACHDGAEWASRLPAAWREFGAGSDAVRRRRETAAVVGAASKRTPNAEARLGRLLRDPAASWFERWAAATTIADLGAASLGTAAAPALRAAMDDPNAAVRRAAVSALGGIASVADRRLVEKQIDAADPFLALDAAIALGRLGDPLVLSRLSRVTQRPDLSGEFRAQLALGQAALITSDWALAERSLRRALELNPAALHAWNDLGVALLGQQRDDEARSVWKRILETHPGYAAARKNLEENAPATGKAER